jgi:hypothetical protein
LFLPPVEGLLGDPGLPAHLDYRDPYLHLLQNRHDLLYRKTLPLHGKSPFSRSDSAGN